jgi:hypothetical protein
MEVNGRVDGQEPATRRSRRTSGLLTAKSISIKDAKRRAGGCARKTVELTPGDLLRVASATEVVEKRPDRGGEVSRGKNCMNGAGQAAVWAEAFFATTAAAPGD